MLGAHADQILAEVDRHGATGGHLPRLGGGPGGVTARRRGGAGGSSMRSSITLGDQPTIDARAIDRVVGARATGGGRCARKLRRSAGHPVLLEREPVLERAARRRVATRVPEGCSRAPRVALGRLPTGSAQATAIVDTRRAARAQRGRIELSPSRRSGFAPAARPERRGDHLRHDRDRHLLRRRRADVEPAGRMDALERLGIGAGGEQPRVAVAGGAPAAERTDVAGAAAAARRGSPARRTWGRG